MKIIALEMLALELGTRGWVLMGLIVWCVTSIPAGVLVGKMIAARPDEEPPRGNRGNRDDYDSTN